jgi:hypothetical protein
MMEFSPRTKFVLCTRRQSWAIALLWIVSNENGLRTPNSNSCRHSDLVNKIVWMPHTEIKLFLIELFITSSWELFVYLSTHSYAAYINDSHISLKAWKQRMSLHSAGNSMNYYTFCPPPPKKWARISTVIMHSDRVIIWTELGLVQARAVPEFGFMSHDVSIL